MKITSLNTTHTAAPNKLVFNIDSPPPPEVNVSALAWGSLSVSLKDGLLYVSNDGSAAIDYHVVASIESNINAAQKSFEKDKRTKDQQRSEMLRGMSDAVGYPLDTDPED